MSQPDIALRLEGARHDFQPGEELAGEYHLVAIGPEELRAVELSILWYTEGTGDEDLAVHFFDRSAPEEGHEFDVAASHAFRCRLPSSPLSYDGLIVKLKWCVRVRAFLSQGKDVLAELPFQLGNVPAPVAPEEGP